MLTYWKIMIVLLAVVIILAATAVPCAAAPKDPPVSEGGEGDSENDWDDYGFVSAATLWFRRNSTNFRASRLLVTIQTSNSNFDSSHCRNSDATNYKVEHLHYDKDYGSDFGGADGTVTAAEGKDYFDWTYDGYTPKPTGGDGATGLTNCMSYAYHEYKAPTTKAAFWVNPAAASKYRSELEPIASSGDNGSFYALVDDRCDDASKHVWIVKTAPGGCAATSIEWKNNSSGIYVWTPNTPTNDAPRGNPPTNSFYETYAIYNKAKR